MANCYSLGRRPAGTGTGRGVGEAIVLKRRQRDDTLATYGETVKGLTKMNARADWEHTLAAKADATQLHHTVSKLKNQHESQLHSRRLRWEDLI
jgi:hypothetical protein